jgi:hypothetical protein
MAVAPWIVSDELWELFEPLLPKKERRFRYPGRGTCRASSHAAPSADCRRLRLAPAESVECDDAADPVLRLHQLEPAVHVVEPDPV